MIRKRAIPVTTTGSAGSATGTATLSLGRPGLLMGLSVDFSASAPATTDLTVKADNASGLTLFAVSNTATDVAQTPVLHGAKDEAGAAIAETSAQAFAMFSTGIYVDVAQSVALAPAVTVFVWVLV